MKFKNIFFGFLRTLLLIIAFYSSALYADQYMFLDLRDYPYTTHDLIVSILGAVTSGLCA
jgi:hypothetical protein